MKVKPSQHVEYLETENERVKLVLCAPEGSRNVGAVCRAMGSMGFSRLYITGRNKSFFDREEVFTMGLNSARLFDAAVFLDAAPKEALARITADCSMVAGLTRRRGAHRKYFSLRPSRLRERIGATAGQIALLFGNERSGLSDEELSYCNLACHIPTHPQQASLNLSHAVQIVLYELSQLQGPSGGPEPLTQTEVCDLSRELVQHMQAMGLHDTLGNQRTELFLRDILSRAMLERLEAQRLCRVFQTLRYNKARSSDVGSP